MYEIVPVDPLSKLQKKHQTLEEDIREIKSALRGTVGLSKIESNADQFIQRMLELMTSSQKMVEEVASSNQKVATRIQAAIDKMNQVNEELSVKLTQILNFFAQATDAMTDGGDSESSDDLVDSLNNLKKIMEGLAESNAKTNQVLGSLDTHLKKRVARRRPSQMQRLPSLVGIPPAAPPQAPPASQQGQAQGQRKAPAQGGEPDLPPPPFPP